MQSVGFSKTTLADLQKAFHDEGGRGLDKSMIRQQSSFPTQPSAGVR